MKRTRFVLISALLLLAASFLFASGCDYITGAALDKTATTASLMPRWWWSSVDDTSIDDTYHPSTIVDRYTGQLIKDVTPHEAFGIIGTSSYLGNPIVIDVRTPQEYAGGHIRDAINIDLNSASFKDDIVKLDRNFTCIVYCQAGVRSAAARKIMEELGFKHVINMNGGISVWIAQGLPVAK